MKIVITGAQGFLAYHLRCHLLKFKEYNLSLIDRADLSSEQILSEKLNGADAVIHLAGVNRGTESEVYDGNLKMAETLVKAFEKMAIKPHLVFSSSTHIFKETPYGKTKKKCGELFQNWAKANEAAYTELIIPHIFGEKGRPFYNSVVSTFCHQITHKETPVVNDDAELNLVHASQVAIQILDVVKTGQTGQLKMDGTKITVKQVLKKIQDLHKSYENLIIPHFETAFDLQLFNTIRSYMFPEYYPLNLKLHTDNRGNLFEAVKTDHGGQAFLSTTKPGITRGQHYHYHKIERFCVIRGQGTIQIRQLLTDKVHEFKVSGDAPCFIDMPTLHTHNITNTGTSELITLFWSHEIFDQNNPDTFPELV